MPAPMFPSITFLEIAVSLQKGGEHFLEEGFPPRSFPSQGFHEECDLMLLTLGARPRRANSLLELVVRGARERARSRRRRHSHHTETDAIRDRLLHHRLEEELVFLELPWRVVGRVAQAQNADVLITGHVAERDG